jgi:3-hydroxybenzoate 6-monooxygenase
MRIRIWLAPSAKADEVMMANGRNPLLVLGGGIGGVAAALSLARCGRRVHVLEKAPELAEIGAGLQLAPNAMRVLDWLGILERIKSAAVFPQTLNLLDIVTAKRLKTVRADRRRRPLVTCSTDALFR